ncbi:MAG: SpoIID/LytB domain-containing protein [Bacteroidales bacterium]|nr:SpoIID/LytB domain-containing protein [Bacteroidales bacterium]
MTADNVEPVIRVGIGTFGKVTYTKNGESHTITPADCPVSIIQQKGECIEISDVEIGINFHWSQRERQKFEGDMEFINTDGKVLAINIIKLEDYICSVISSEMNGDNPLELLKAHAVISRSWLMAQISGGTLPGEKIYSDAEISTWYDREAHSIFDVCADDHCQRYQGITRAHNPNVRKAIEATRGLMLMYDGEPCDARFSKCCGGKTELFENCWQPVHFNYLESADCPYCNTNDQELLKKVLNTYDVTTRDFYRWDVTLGNSRIKELLKTKAGEDLGDIIDMTPLHRGPSGRITRLEIRGSKKTKIFGKELEIRRLLSDSHLYSSAFDVEKNDNGSFVLHGWGWGHGVGLCQIGAAVMASQGHSFTDILQLYYKGAELKKMY